MKKNCSVFFLSLVFCEFNYKIELNETDDCSLLFVRSDRCLRTAIGRCNKNFDGKGHQSYAI